MDDDRRVHSAPVQAYLSRLFGVYLSEMSHSTRALTVLVVHINNTVSYCTASRAQRAVDSGVAHWHDKEHTRLHMIKTPVERLNPNYEFRGRPSIDLLFNPHVPSCDRTGIPQINAGGTTLQLTPKHDRRTTGRHITRQDKLRRRSH